MGLLLEEGRKVKLSREYSMPRSTEEQKERFIGLWKGRGTRMRSEMGREQVLRGPDLPC